MNVAVYIMMAHAHTVQYERGMSVQQAAVHWERQITQRE